jgi:putative acetyltransferase
MLEIRLEESQDQNAAHRLNLAAFGNGPEAALVDTLRSSCKEYLAFVALEDGA